VSNEGFFFFFGEGTPILRIFDEAPRPQRVYPCFLGSTVEILGKQSASHDLPLNSISKDSGAFTCRNIMRTPVPERRWRIENYPNWTRFHIGACGAEYNTHAIIPGRCVGRRVDGDPFGNKIESFSSRRPPDRDVELARRGRITHFRRGTWRHGSTARPPVIAQQRARLA